MLAATSNREFLSAIGIHANDLGRVYAAAYALLLFTWWESKRPGLKTFLFITMGVLAFALMLTFSRGAFTGFIVVNLLFLAWKFNAKTAMLAIAAIAIFAIFAPGYLYSRVMLGVDSGDANTVSAGRIDEIWLPLLPEIFKSPIWGNGLGSVMWSSPMLAGAMHTVDHPHNAYFETLLDMGIVGLGVLLAFYWYVWRGLRKLGSNAYLSPEMRGFFQGAAASLIAFLVSGMAGSSLRPTFEFVHLWMAIGMMYGLLARRPAG
jgi:O-antigen ligase